MADALKLPPPGFMTPPKSKKRKRSESPESPGTPYSPAFEVDLGPFGEEMAREAQREEEALALARARGLVTPNRPTRKNEPPPLKRKG